MCLPANAEPSEGWSIYRDEGGLVAEFPVGIFTKDDAGPTEKGTGRRFTSDDGPYQFVGYTFPDPNREAVLVASLGAAAALPASPHRGRLNQLPR